MTEGVQIGRLSNEGWVTPMNSIRTAKFKQIENMVVSMNTFQPPDKAGTSNQV